MLWAVLAGAPGSTDDFFGKIAKDSGIQPH
jgi:hypothetical protein